MQMDLTGMTHTGLVLGWGLCVRKKGREDGNETMTVRMKDRKLIEISGLCM